MSLTIAGIETTIGADVAKALADIKTTGATLTKIATDVGVDVEKIEPLANKIIATFFPQYAGASAMVEALVNAAIAAVSAVGVDLTSDVPMNLPVELAKTVKAFETSWKAAKTAPGAT